MECARRLPPLGGGASQSLFLFRVRCIALPCPIHPSRPSAILSSAFGPTRIATLRLLPPCFGCLSMYPQLSSRRCFASRRSSFLSSSSLFRFARSSLTSVCLLSLAIALDSLRRGSLIITLSSSLLSAACARARQPETGRGQRRASRMVCLACSRRWLQSVSSRFCALPW